MNKKILLGLCIFLFIFGVVCVIADSPVVSNVILNSTNITINDTYQNLTSYYDSSDADSDNITFAYNWYKNGVLNATTLINDNSLILYWPLDNDTYDYKGNNNGTASSYILDSTMGKIGGGVHFDGSGYYIDSDNTIGISGSAARTITAWFKLDSDYNVDASYPILYWGAGSSGNLCLPSVQHNEISFAGYSADLQGITPLSADRWYFYAMTYDGTATLYLDGIFDSSGVLSLSTTNSAIKVGEYHVSEGWSASKMKIDEIQIYNRSLSASEIKMIYDGSAYGGNIMNASQTTSGDIWKVGVLGGDYIGWGAEVNSSNITITDICPTWTTDIGNDTCVLNNTYTFTDGEIISHMKTLIIGSNGSIYNGNNRNSTTLNFTNIIISNGGNITGGNITIYTGNLDVGVLTNLVTTMTSNTTPAGVATCSDIINPTYNCWVGFNNVYGGEDINSDAWFSSDSAFPKYLQYQFSSGKIVDKYVIHNRGGAGNENRKPKNWTFLGSNDGSTWTVLDTQVNQFNGTTGYSNGTYSFTNSNSYTYYRINISANWGATYVTIGELQLFSTAIIENTAKIYSVGLGWNGGAAAADGTGPGYGGTGGSTAGGGAHGGNGGYMWQGLYRGVAYGSSLYPNTLGSGGGGGDVAGGAGGGLVRLFITNTLDITGTINVSGKDGAACVQNLCGGGGAGGGLYIDTVNLIGNGYIGLLGGGSTGPTSAAGSGGGGRGAIYYNTNSFPVKNSFAIPGIIGYKAQNGTLIFADKDDNSLIIPKYFIFQNLTGKANETRTPNTTFWNSNDPYRINVTNFTMYSGAVILSHSTNITINISNVLNNLDGNTGSLNGTFYTSGNLTINMKYASLNFSSAIISTGVTYDYPAWTYTGPTKSYLSIPSLTGNVNLISSLIYSNIILNVSNLSIDSSSTINVNSLGYSGGIGGTSSGSGPGGGTYSSTCGGGGANGGDGGNDWLNARKGTAYGSSLYPNEFGSGGSGGGSGATGGSGGGLIKLTVSNLFDLSGTLTANGGNGLDGSSTNDGAGGSGGSIYINASTFSGAGAITANGGTSIYSGSCSGNGGGGRVAIYYNTLTWTGASTSSVLPGNEPSAAQYVAQNGTMIFIDKINNGAIITGGFRFQNLTGKANETGTPNTTFWNSNTPGFYNFTNLTIYGNTKIITENNDINVTINYLNVTNSSGFVWSYAGTSSNLFLNITSTNMNENLTNIDFYLYKGLTIQYPYAIRKLNNSDILTYTSGSAITIINKFNETLDIIDSSYGTNANQTMTKFGFNDNLKNLILTRSGIYAGYINISVSNLTLDSSSTLYTSYLGWSGGSVSNGNGLGPGAGTGSSNCGSGAGHSGAGGKNWDSSVAGGISYGSSLYPLIFGSGGGAQDTAGGAGGGIISIVTSGNLILNGTAKADASGSGGARSGGGSGGSIYVNVNNLSGVGNFSAKGGSSVLASNCAGNGAGGRVAVYYNYSTFTGIYNSFVTQGLIATGAYAQAGMGSMIFVDNLNNLATIKDGFRFQALTGTNNESGVSNKSFWNSNTVGTYNFTNITMINATLNKNVTGDLILIYNTLINISNTTWNILPNIKIENQSSGMINYNRTINQTNFYIIPGQINITDYLIQVASTNNINLNKSADLYFYNGNALGIGNKRILMNDVICPSTICTLKSNGNNYTINVTGFTDYELDSYINTNCTYLYQNGFYNFTYPDTCGIGINRTTTGFNTSGNYISFIYFNETASKFNITSALKQYNIDGTTQDINGSIGNITIQTRTANTYNITDPNLVGLWVFNNETGDNGTVWKDKTGRFDANCTGATCAKWGEENGTVGGGLYLDGVNDYIGLGNIGPVNNFTVCVWYKRNSYKSQSEGIISRYYGSDNFIELAIDTTPTVQFFFHQSGTVYRYWDAPAPNGTANLTWHHYCGTRGDNNNLSLYIDGVVVGGYSNIRGSPTAFTDTGPLVAGNSGGWGPNKYLAGLIDEIRLYNRTLTLYEVSNLYNQSSYQFSDWGAWSSETNLTDHLTTQTSSAKFMQFKLNYNTNNIDVSPYLLDYNVTKSPATSAGITFNSLSAENSFAITQFVKANGSRFTLAGVNYTLMGADAYYLSDYATNHTYDDEGNEINNSIIYVNEVLDKAKALNVNVIRTWAGMFGGNTSVNTTSWIQNQSGGHYNLFLNGNYTNYNETTFKGLDYVIYEASKRDIRLQLVLVNNWDTYGGMCWFVQQSSTSNKVGMSTCTQAFHDQFYNDSGTIAGFQSYVNYVLNRVNTYSGITYKNDPAIFAWLLANEPRYGRDSRAQNHSVLANWTRNMTTYIKSIDSNHLVGLGIEGFGYNETWGEGTDMISSHNNTGVDFATFELHPSQWDYFAQRSENQTNGAWVNGTIAAGIPSQTMNNTLDWWTTGRGYTYNNRYNGNIPLYTPNLGRHNYSNWVSQNTNWSSNLLNMPVLLQEVALPNNVSILTDGQKDRFYHNLIYNFYSSGGDGMMMWNLNHDNYFYSTAENGLMDDGYSFYFSSDPTLKALSQGVINAYSYVRTNNTGGTSWVTSLNNYKQTLSYNISLNSLAAMNCSLWLNITNITNQSTGYTRDQLNGSEVIDGATDNNTFTKSFATSDQFFYWKVECCDNTSVCSNSTANYVLLSNQPEITITNPADNYLSNNTFFTLNYSITDSLGVNKCELYIDGLLNQTNTTITTDVNQYFTINITPVVVDGENRGEDFNWQIICTDTGSNIGYSEVRTFIYEPFVMNVTLTGPPTNSYQSNATQNYSVFINSSAPISTINWYLNDALQDIYTSTTTIYSTTYGYVIALVDGIYNWYYNVLDIFGISKTSETWNVTIDTVKPLIEFVYPTEINNSNWSRTWIYANITIDDINYNLTNLTLWNITGFVNSTSLNETNFTNLPDGIYYINATTIDLAGNYNYSETRTLTLDTINPTINFTAPTETNNSNWSRNWIYANVTSSDTNIDSTTINLYNTTSLVSSSDLCYQETATTATSCGGLNTGNYSYDGGNIYINYTNPLNASLWQIKFGNNISNVTIPNICQNNQIRLKIYTEDISGNNNAAGYCYNGTDWQLITANYHNHDSISVDNILSSASYGYDGDWSTGLSYVTSNFWHDGSSPVSTKFYEEAMWWDMNRSSNEINFTSLPDGVYYLNATVYDHAGNLNSTETRQILLDTTPPTIQFVNPTKANATFWSYTWIYANVTVSDINWANTSINLYNSDGTLYNKNRCYQESANVSTSCGGLSTGNYAFYDITNYQYCFDGDWSTYCERNHDHAHPAGWFYVNYTKPIGIGLLNTSQLQLKQYYQTKNLSIPNDCWNQDILQFNFSIGNGNWEYSTTDMNISITCYNSSNWKEIYLTTITAAIYEEAMWWNISSSLNETNFTNLPDGVYYLNATSYDIVNNKNSTETRNITLDTTPPTINLSYPINTSVYSDSQLNLTWSYVDLYLDYCGYELDGVFAPISTNITMTGLLNQWHTLSITCVDLAGNSNTTNITFLVNTPTATLWLPLNYTDQYSPVTFMCEAYSGFGANITNVSLYLNSTGVWNSTMIQNGSGNINYTFTKELIVGTYDWNCQVCDNYSCIFDEQNYTVKVVPTPIISGGGSTSGAGGKQEAIQNITLNNEIVSSDCNSNSLLTRIKSNCKLDNGICDDGENLFIDKDCDFNIDEFKSGEIFQNMWVIRFLLIATAIMYLMGSAYVPLIIIFLMGLFSMHGVFSSLTQKTVGDTYQLPVIETIQNIINVFITKYPTQGLIGLAAIGTAIWYFVIRPRRIIRSKRMNQ